MIQEEFLEVVHLIKISKPSFYEARLKTADQQLVLKRALQDCDIVDAKTVIHRLTEGTLSMPTELDDVIPFMCQTCKQLQLDRESNERRYRDMAEDDSGDCERCHNTGLVTIRDEKGARVGYRCRCKRGARWLFEETGRVSAWKNRDPLPMAPEETQR